MSVKVLVLQQRTGASSFRKPKNHPSRFAPEQRSLLGRPRQRKKIMSEKIGCWLKLMPWDKKMETATWLEKAHEYVRFLQAQVKVLQSMPVYSCFNVDVFRGGNGEFGDVKQAADSGDSV